jgi:Tol biopolymer transport system component
MDAEGHKSAVSAGWADIRGLAWSADGREVWFAATRSGSECALWAVDLQGRTRPVFRGPGSLALHDIGSDGRVLVAVHRRRLQVYGLGPGETKERELTWLDYGIVSDLSRDGKTLLFQEQGEGGGSEYTAYIRGMDGRPPVRLGKGAAMTLSPDGSQALVINLTLPMQVVLLPTGPGQARTLPRGRLVQIQAGAFLPDGKQIVLLANAENEAPRFYVQAIEGGEPRAISSDGFSITFAIPVTPDGAFLVGGRDGRVLLYPVAGGGEPRAIPGTALNDAPLRFSPDGRYLFVIEGLGATGTVYRVDTLRGTRERWKQIVREGGPGAALPAYVLSPDGNSYAYTFREDTSTLYVAEGLH